MTTSIARMEIAGPGGNGVAGSLSLEKGDILGLRGVDILVVSAFAGDYTPTAGSVIGQLANNAQPIDVAALAMAPDEDLRQQARVWLSAPLPEGAPARRLLCFESPDATSARGPMDTVADLFLGLASATLRIAEDRVDAGQPARPAHVAMPILGTGDQDHAISDMLPAILRAACEWMAQGMPVADLRIVVRPDDPRRLMEAQKVFTITKKEIADRHPPPQAEPRHDLFISYAHRDAHLANAVIDGLRSRAPTLRIWQDVSKLAHDPAWMLTCFEAIDESRAMLALLTENYVASRNCLLEFTAGWTRTLQTGGLYLKPLYLLSAPLPSFVQMPTWIDCREFDESRLAAAYAEISRLVDR